MTERKYNIEPENDEENAKADYEKTAGIGRPIPREGLTREPLTIHFGAILLWIFPRLVIGAVVLYLVFRLFELFPVR